MQTKIKAFTLIELMIVIAIIGILAAIAIPLYQQYIAKSQFGRVLGELSGLKTSIETHYSRGDLETDAVEHGYTASNLITGQPAILMPADGTATIIATLSTQANSIINNESITLSRGADSEWTCTSTVAVKYRPSSC